MTSLIAAPLEAHTLSVESADIPAVLDLLQRSFAFMEGRIDPPSSLHKLNVAALREHCSGPPGREIWCLGRPPQACVFLTPKPHVLYLGRLAVAQDQRGHGLARRLVEIAERRAQALGLTALELQVRVELVENLAAFTKMGFEEVARTAHPGFDRATSVTLQCPVPPTVPPTEATRASTTKTDL